MSEQNENIRRQRPKTDKCKICDQEYRNHWPYSFYCPKCRCKAKKERLKNFNNQE